MRTNFIRCSHAEDGFNAESFRRFGVIPNLYPMAVQVVHRDPNEDDEDEDADVLDSIGSSSEEIGYSDADLASILVETMLALGMDVQDSEYEDVPTVANVLMELHAKYEELGVVAKLFVEALTEKDIKKVPALAEFKKAVLEAMPEDVSFYIPSEEPEDTEEEAE